MKYKLEMIPVDSFVINRRNPRKIKDSKYLELKESLRNFPEMMNVDPVVFYFNEVDDRVIIRGNQRMRAMRELGWEVTPAVNVTGWSEQQIKEFLVKSNLHAGEFDTDILYEDYDLDLLKSWGIDFIDEFVQEFEKIDNRNAEMPIVPRYNEKYGAVIIVMKNETEIAAVETILELQKELCYKTDYVEKSYVITADKLVGLWKK